MIQKSSELMFKEVRKLIEYHIWKVVESVDWASVWYCTFARDFSSANSNVANNLQHCC